MATGSLKVDKNVSLLDVKEVHTIRVVEHIKDVIVPNFVEKDVFKPNFTEVTIEKPIIREKVVEVNTVKTQDISKKVADEAIRMVRDFLNNISVEVTGSGSVNFKTKK